MNYAEVRKNILLYFPESFEWLLLRSGTASNRYIRELDHPEDYIDSETYASWEQYFTELLKAETMDNPLRQYQKSKLPAYYIQGLVRDRIVRIFPKELQEYLRALQKNQENK